MLDVGGRECGRERERGGREGEREGRERGEGRRERTCALVVIVSGALQVTHNSTRVMHTVLISLHTVS